MKRRVYARVAMAIGALLLLAWASAAITLDAYGRRAAPSGTFDAIVVAGCAVYPGGEPSPSLARRVRRAVALWKEGRAPVIVFTGGVGANPPSEAEASARLAESLGVPRAQMLLEDRSTTTRENAEYARPLTEAQRILVVTDAFHVARVERLFGRQFREVHGVGTVASAWPRSKGAAREVLAWLVELTVGT